MIELHKDPGQRVLELGGGDNRHPQADCNVDVRPGGRVDFTVNFEEAPWPIADTEWDVVYSHFVLEHVSWRKVSQFLAEVYRITKPGGRVVFAVPNTQAQMEHLLRTQDWEDAGSMLFGGQDYHENAHKAAFSPTYARKVFEAAGFADVIIHPYGAKETDMVVVAQKPKAEKWDRGLDRIKAAGGLPTSISEYERQVAALPDVNPFTQQPAGGAQITVGGKGPLTTGEIEKMRAEWRERTGGELPGVNWERPPAEQALAEHYQLVQQADEARFSGEKVQLADAYGPAYFAGPPVYDPPGYRDYPRHEITARKVLERKPASVLELGCGRGYVLKRLQDAGVDAHGIDMSRHCELTRVCENFGWADLRQTPWGIGIGSSRPQGFDLCFSNGFLEHLPEAALPAVVKEMARICKRGLHGITFDDEGDGGDKTRVTLRPAEWWRGLFASYAPGWPVEIHSRRDLDTGNFPEDVLKGDGKVKLNLGCGYSMFWHGWVNADCEDLARFAQLNGHQFRQLDVRQGLPGHATGSVDLIYLGHLLERLPYREGLALLRECRRVLKRDGAMRLAVADTSGLLTRYHNDFCDHTGNHSDFGNGTTGELGDVAVNVQQAATPAAKLSALLCEGRQALYDAETLERSLEEAGFVCGNVGFRQGHKQILAEGRDTHPGIALYYDAMPRVG